MFPLRPFAPAGMRLPSIWWKPVRAWTLTWIVALCALHPSAASARWSWILPESDDAAVQEAAVALMAGDVGRGLRVLDAAESADAGAAAPQRHYLRALMMSAIGRHAEATEPVQKGLAALGQRRSQDYVRLFLLRTALSMRRGDAVGALANSVQAPSVAQEVFGDAHPATTFARVVEAVVSLDAFARPQSLDIALAKLGEAQRKLAPLPPGGQAPEHGGEEFVSRALLFQSAGQVLMQKRSFDDARRMFDGALANLRVALRAPPPATDTLRLMSSVLIGIDEDRLLGHAATAAAYLQDPVAARQLSASATQRAHQLGGAARARWAVTATMSAARALGDCQAVERLLAPPLADRDGQQLRALQLREVGTCWTVVAKDPARAQPFFDEAQDCAAGGERCPRP